jgi:hypothetical protein
MARALLLLRAANFPKASRSALVNWTAFPFFGILHFSSLSQDTKKGFDV